MTPRRVFTTFATAEAVTWTLLLLGMVLKYVTHTTELGVRVFGLVHGFVFLAYVAVTIAVGIDRRWGRGTMALGVLASVPPYATVFFERHVLKRGLLEGDWQVREGRTPTTAPEKLLAWAVTRPALAVTLLVVVLVAVTGVLSWLGPPVPQR